jgi:hypothetical protein
MRYVVDTDDTEGYRVYIIVDTETGIRSGRYVSLDRANIDCSELNQPD